MSLSEGKGRDPDVVEDVLEQKTALAFGALLHDVGKVVIRGNSAREKHSKLGADFITEEIAPLNAAYDSIMGKRIVEQIRFHHAGELSSAASLDNRSLAFITYFADNISAGMDRKDEGDEAQKACFDKSARLQKIFNILNGHHDKNVIEHDDYNLIREDLKRNLIEMGITWNQVNSVINMLEATVSTVPSSTDTTQLIDVSLYDHAKTTAGIAACIYDYLQECEVTNYREALFDRNTSPAYYEKPMFLLYSCDMSGIQDFIYNISGDKALKQLRARSLYLEMLLEHIVDELLDRLELSRANLLYTGGGHAYLLLPNTCTVKRIAEETSAELRSWFLEHYHTDLYIADAFVECSANDLSNSDSDGERYRNLYRDLSAKLSEAKASRYTAAEIRKLNFKHDESIDHSRECTECHRSDLEIDNDNKCSLCSALRKISADLVMKDAVFVVSKDEDAEGLILPFGGRLTIYKRDKYLAEAPQVARIYTKNSWDTGIALSTHIWMGDYPENGHVEISYFARDGATLRFNAEGKQLGIERLGVLRADVDNLGAVFVNGLPNNKVSISRTATLSRALSYFFKKKVNDVLESGKYQAQIIYSGGDDLFIIGNWSDVIYAAVDIRNALDEFTGNGTLTISAGIGMYPKKYPIARMADEVGQLEDAAKLFISPDGRSTKNAIALWAESSVFGWQEFVEQIAPRVRELESAFDDNEKGKAFIYKLVALLRDIDRPISAPRIAYLLARSFEDVGDSSAMSKKIYDWALDDDERGYLIAALEWYVYSIRERG